MWSTSGLMTQANYIRNRFYINWTLSIGMKTKCQLLKAGSINYSFCLYVCAAASSQTQKKY